MTPLGIASSRPLALIGRQIAVAVEVLVHGLRRREAKLALHLYLAKVDVKLERRHLASPLTNGVRLRCGAANRFIP